MGNSNGPTVNMSCYTQTRTRIRQKPTNLRDRQPLHFQANAILTQANIHIIHPDLLKRSKVASSDIQKIMTTITKVLAPVNGTMASNVITAMETMQSRQWFQVLYSTTWKITAQTKSITQLSCDINSTGYTLILRSCCID